MRVMWGKKGKWGFLEGAESIFWWFPPKMELGSCSRNCVLTRDSARRPGTLHPTLEGPATHPRSAHLGPPHQVGAGSDCLTHDTDTNVTRRGTTRLQQAPAEKDDAETPAIRNGWNRGLHRPATPPPAPRASAPTTTHPPHRLQTASTPRHKSGVQSWSRGTST